MLTKLMKYELKATARVVLPTFLGLLLFSIIARFSLAKLLRAPALATGEGMAGLAGLLPRTGILLYGFAILAVGVVVLVVIIQRFYKNLTGDEGYLMFTLPVRPWQLIWSKLLVATLWQLLAALAIFLSLSILLLQGEIMGFLTRELPVLWAAARPYLPRSPLLWLLWLAVIPVSSLANTLLIYAAIAIGHTIRGHRVLGAILSYFALTTVIQIASTPLGLLAAGPLMRTDLETAAGISRFVSDMLLYVPLLSLGMALLMLAGLSYLTGYIFEKQLNLD